MQLEWMGQYRELMEKLIRYGNAYAQNYNREVDLGEGVRFTPAQLQALEYILENEDGCQNMAQIAARLGISPSSFSKNVAKMVEKGFLEKYHTSSNRKDVIIRVSPAGKEAYQRYIRTLEPIFQQLAVLWGEIPNESIGAFLDALELLSRYNRVLTEESQIPPSLIRIQ